MKCPVCSEKLPKHDAACPVQKKLKHIRRIEKREKERKEKEWR